MKGYEMKALAIGLLAGILLVGALLLIKDYSSGYRVSLLASLRGDKLDAHVLFYYPLIDIFIRMQDEIPVIHVAVFKLDVIKIALEKKGHARKGIRSIRLLRSIVLSHIDVDACFGFEDPFSTAVACAAAGAASRFLPVDRLHLEPVFFPGPVQFVVDAHASLRVGKTILNYLKNKP